MSEFGYRPDIKKAVKLWNHRLEISIEDKHPYVGHTHNH